MLRLPALALTLSLALSLPLARASVARADDADGERASASSAPSEPGLTWQPGPAPELWAAPAVSLSLGGLSLLAAIVLGQVGNASYHEAIDPSTTQTRAAELGRMLPDLELGANVLYGVGAGLVTIGAIWLVVLPFSQHPAPTDRASASASASVSAPSLHLSLAPGGLSLGGSF